MRTTVFLKGCSFSLQMVQQPRKHPAQTGTAYKLNVCIGTKECALCLKECPESAIFTVDSDVKVRINWDLCTNCSKCVPVCPPKALYMFGEAMTVDQVMDEVEQDSAFYRESGGGITLSGGECLLQADFSAGSVGGSPPPCINTAIETAGNVPWAFMEKVLHHVDLVQHDLKVTDPENSQKNGSAWTTTDAAIILGVPMKHFRHKFICRTPLIPGVNDDEDHIRATLSFIKPYKNVIDYELLPYMRFRRE